MKLLICTQKVDINDDILGFMHGWIAEFAKQCEQVTVICLFKGEYKLPANVKILSLGKEKTNIQYLKKCYYAIRFLKYIWQERSNYDSIFVHMNPEYVVLGGLFWRVWKKRVFLWNNHISKNLFTIIAPHFVKKIFHTSPYANFAGHSKAQIMPAGIDTGLFSRNSSLARENKSILYLGRIAPIKNIQVLIKAIGLLRGQGHDFVLNIVGSPGEKDNKYYQDLKKLVKGLKIEAAVRFRDGVPNHQAPKIYNQNSLFVNMTNSGSLDKTILEAMACECLTIVCNRSFENIFPREWHSLLFFKENDAKDMADKIAALFKIDIDQKLKMGKQLRNIVINQHSQNKLFGSLIKAIK